MKYINEYNDYEQKLLDQGKVYYFTTNLIKDLEIKYDDKFPHSTFFAHKDTGIIWMEDDKKSGELHVSRKYIWSKIETSFPYDYLKISDLLKYVVEICFKMSVGTPMKDRGKSNYMWKLVSK